MESVVSGEVRNGRLPLGGWPGIVRVLTISYVCDAEYPTVVMHGEK